MPPPPPTRPRRGVASCCAAVLVGLATLASALVALAGLVYVRHGSLTEPAYDAAYELLPYIPSVWFQELGVQSTWAVTCVALPWARRWGLVSPALQCRLPEEKDALWVMVSVPKGGAIMSGRICPEISQACGLCFAIGSRTQDEWPPTPDTLPPHRADVLGATANLVDWPAYADREPGRLIRCVVVVRDPFARLASLYTYTRDGGESGLWPLAPRLHEFDDQPEAGLQWLWDTMARESMVRTHRMLTLSLARPECNTTISFDRSAKDFDGEMDKWLDAWHVAPGARPALLDVMRRQDLSRRSAEQLARDHHVSGKDLSPDFKRRLKRAMWTIPDVRDLLLAQRKDLGLPLDPPASL